MLWWLVSVALAVPALPRVVPEASGLVVSQAQPGVMWTHNDSGGKPELFAIAPSGHLLARVKVRGAQAKDWESISAGPDGTLFVADMGNNLNLRKDLTLYQVREPTVGVDESVDVLRSWTIVYPEQKAFPDRADMNYDTEAIFYDAGNVYLLTKHRSDVDTTLYRVPLDAEGTVQAQKISTFQIGSTREGGEGRVTGADLHPSGRYLVVLCYHEILVFERPEAGDDWLSAPHGAVLFDTDEVKGAEGVAWDGWSVVIVTEGDRIHRVVDPFRISGDLYPRRGLKP